MKLQEIEKEIEKYFVIKDKYMLKVLMSTLIGNIFNMNPLWTIFVAPSSGGKSAIITLANKIPVAKFLDDLTEKTFLSGFKIKGKEVSLLKAIGNGILVFSDFTTIITKNQQSKAEILTQLRMIYDGSFKKMTGTGETIWNGKMGLIAGCTPTIYDELEYAKAMGERFCYYEIVQPTAKEIFDKQITYNRSDKQINDELSELFIKYFSEITTWLRTHTIKQLELSQEQSDRLWESANICVRGKATVHRDFKSQKIDKLPNISGPGRDNKMYMGYLYTLHVIRCYEFDNPDLPISYEDIEAVEKIAYSSLSRERRKVLEILAETNIPLKASEIGVLQGFGLEGDMVNPYLQTLHAVGLINKITGNPHKWYILEDNIRNFVNRISKLMNKNESAAVPDEPPDSEDSGTVDFDALVEQEQQQLLEEF